MHRRRFIPRSALIAPALLAGFCLCSVSGTRAQAPVKSFQLVMLSKNRPTGIRAVSVVNDSVAWVGGSNGYVGHTTDGGKTWHWADLSRETAMPGGEKPDFRSIAAFSSRKAIVANAGSPAYILLTTDAGRHWKKVYSNRDSAVFLDGIAFRNNKNGLVYGDPVRGRFLILRTKDGGKRWKALPFRRRPVAIPGEVSFAAGNSDIASLPHAKYVWIGTGGIVSRVFFSKNFGKSWEVFPTPVLQGKSSTGIFSLAFISKHHGICVGGDYINGAARLNNAALTENGGKNWQKPIINPFGYRSCVLYDSPDTLFATGTSGTDLSVNGGVTWQRISNQGFNTIGKARNGKMILLAGTNGRIAKMLFSTKYAGKRPSSLKDQE